MLGVYKDTLSSGGNRDSARILYAWHGNKEAEKGERFVSENNDADK